MPHKPGRARRQPRGGEAPRGWRTLRRKPLPWPGQHADRHELKNILPATPMMNLHHIICPHKPSKLRAGIDCPQPAQAVAGEPCVQLGFHIGDDNARMINHAPGMGHPFVERRRSLRLQRIGRADQPPDLIKIKTLQRLLGDPHMPFMGRIKRPAQKADAPPSVRFWQVKPLHSSPLAQIDPCASHGRACFRNFTFAPARASL